MSSSRWMRSGLLLMVAMAFAAAQLAAAGQQQQPAAQPAATDPGWPRELTKDGVTLVYYQPQIDEWKDYRELLARAAFSLTPKGEPVAVGVASMHAETQADLEARTVVIRNVQLTDTRFPSLDADRAARMDALLRKIFPSKVLTISLDRLAASVEKSKTPVRPAAVKTDPPTIFVSDSSAILLRVDGKPVRAPVEGTKLEFVVNTTWDLFFDPGQSRYYLLADKSWLTATALEGSWTATRTLPADMQKLPAGGGWDDVKKLVPPTSPGAKAPRVFYSSKPAELISFTGKPVYVPIPETRLVYAKNTESSLFVHSDGGQYYYLTAGRWFRAKSLEGPWSFAGGDLPDDFAKIPPDHPRASVLVSVPGTQEAKDAVLLAQVPTTVVVNRAEAEAQVKVVYTGEPQFAPIETTSLYYATNTQEKVIRAGNQYYLCYQGVWFVSTTPNGPWKTADTIPAELYKIPPSSPVYNVTYVTVSNPTSDTVESSYTAGYMGAFVVGLAAGAALVYGTGYYYAPYYYYSPYYHYPVYYPYPYTYGGAAAYNPYTGRYAAGTAVYGPYGAAGRAGWYNPTTGTYGRAATVQTAYGGRTVAQGYNPYTGTLATTSQGSSPYAQWGTTVVERGDDWAATQRVTTEQGTVRRTETSEGGQAVHARGEQGSATIAQDADNNMYVGNDGNVYKKESDGGWSKYEDGGWNTVDTQGAQAQAQTNKEARSQQAQAQGATAEGAQAQAQANQEARSQQAQAQGARAEGAQAQATGDVLGGLNSEALARERGSQRAQISRPSGGGRAGGGRRR